MLDSSAVACEHEESSLLMPRPHSNARVVQCGHFFGARDPRYYDLPNEEWDTVFDQEIEILSEWRSLHALPLDVVSRQLQKRAGSIDSSATFSQRLKRFTSILAKLRRESTMQLTTMQDIAGCRAVVSTIEQAYELKRKYEEYSIRRPQAGPELVHKWTKDYIRSPKEDGYRSVHFVMKYRASDPLHEHCNGLRIEVQIRSRLQHAWATAVETASTVTNQALKSGEGAYEWQRFFKLMGDFIAMQEEAPLLVVSVEDADNLRLEAAELAMRLRVIPLLEGMRMVLQTFKGSGDDHYYLLILDAANQQVVYYGYPEQRFKDAAQDYAQHERDNRDNKDVHVVLVKVASVNELKQAYPSYFLDSTVFVTLVKQIFQPFQASGKI
jgi:ppGpp synthetase/RelA/SpoT-type nucleotidyltranferase